MVEKIKTVSSIDLASLFCEYIQSKRGFIEEQSELQKVPFLDTTNLASSDVIGDVSSFIRNLLGVFDLGGPMGHLLGEASFLSFLSGGVLYSKGVSAHEQASQGVFYHDETAQWQGFISQYRGLAQVLSGLGLTITRTIALVSALDGGRICHAVSQLSTVAGISGASFASVSCALISLWSSLGLYDSLHLYQKLGFGFFMEDACTAQEVIALLEEEERISVESTLREIQDHHNYKALLEKEVDASVRQFLQKALRLIDHSVEPQVLDAMAKALAEKASAHWSPKVGGLTDKQALGLFIATERKAEIQKNTWRRCLGEAGVSAWERYQSSPKTEQDQEHLVKALRVVLQSTITTQSLVTLIGVLGSIGAAFGAVSFTGEYLLVGCSISVLSSLLATMAALLATYFDGTDLLESLEQKGVVHWQDKAFAGGELFLGVSCVFGMCVIASSSAGTVPMFLAFAGGISWLVVSSVNIYVLHKKELLYAQTHLSVEDLQSKLGDLALRVSCPIGEEHSQEVEQWTHAVQSALKNSRLSEEERELIIQRFHTRRFVKAPMQEMGSILQEWKEREEMIRLRLEEAMKQLHG
ncbi:MAG: hypothetical protein FJZ58_07730 [Chlamydiae bacterium]|nr:hypothetical protein [Chlamydiota bacterium]